MIQSFGSRINFHPHLHFLVTEGGSDKKGQFHKVSQFNDTLLRKHLINQDLVQKILHWRHTGFNVHSKVRTETKEDSERVGKYMIRPILSLKRLSLHEGQVVYQYGKHSSETESMDYP
ncbi:MAG: transposase [Acidobacteriota bacterium]